MFFSEATLDDLLNKAISEIFRAGVPVDSSRGTNTEISGVLLKLTNPRARLSQTETRGKVFSALGELAWYLSGSSDGNFITYYIQRYEQEIEEDGTINGAYGPRLFSAEWGNQFHSVVALLRKNPNTRKAVIQLFDSCDLTKSFKDVPCTCSMQLLIRQHQLHMLVYMRSNDAFWGLPHDVFSFTMMQEIIARMLNLELGEYSHFAGSLHLYTDQVAAARRFLDEGWQSTTRAAMPPMPVGDPWPAIDAFCAFESAIREGRPMVVPRVESLPPYWQDLVRLLEVFRFSKAGEVEAVRQTGDQMVSDVYKQYIIMKQP